MRNKLDTIIRYVGFGATICTSTQIINYACDKTTEINEVFLCSSIGVTLFALVCKWFIVKDNPSTSK